MHIVALNAGEMKLHSEHADTNGLNGRIAPLRGRVATKANPSKGGGAKPRGYRPQRTGARDHASRVAERTQGGVYAAHPMEPRLRAGRRGGRAARAGMPSPGWPIWAHRTVRRIRTSVQLECDSRRVHRGVQVQPAGCG